MAVKIQMQVVLAFGCRLPLIGLSVGRLAAVKEFVSSTELQFTIANFLLNQQILLVWSLISSTIPNLGTFIRSFSTDFGVPTLGWGTEMQDWENVFALHTIGGSCTMYAAPPANTKFVRGQCDLLLNAFRPDGPVHQAVVHSGSKSTSDHPDVADRNGSQELIIKKDVACDISHESL